MVRIRAGVNVHDEGLEKRADAVLSDDLLFGHLLPGDDEGEEIVILNERLRAGLGSLGLLVVRQEGLSGALYLIFTNVRRHV
jgi:hypothetical protein